MAACQVYRNSRGMIQKVLAPDGAPSSLFLKLYTATKEKEEALRLWGYYYTQMEKGLYRPDSHGEPTLEGITINNVESELSFATSSETTDDSIIMATKNLPQPLIDLQLKSDNYTTTSESEHYVNSLSQKKFARITGIEGPINKARMNPYKVATNSYADQTAEAKWEGISPEQELETELGLLNKEKYTDKLKAKLKSTATRGTLIHKYLQLYMTTNKHKKSQLQAEIDALHVEANLHKGFFTWLQRNNNYQTILQKAGVNIYDDVPEEEKDKILSEITVSDEILEWAGTIDLVIGHKDGAFSLTDFKTGWRFNKSASSRLFKYGAQKNLSIFETPRETAKFQLMLYAFMMKAENPDTKFRDLFVTWIPSRAKARLHDHRAKVEVEDYLGLIRDYLRNEEPQKYEALKQRLINKFGEREGGIKFNALFDPNEYEHGYEYNTKRILKEKKAKVTIEEKLQELRILTLYDLPGARKDDYAAAKSANMENVFKDLLTLMNDLDFKEDQVRDISFLSL